MATQAAEEEHIGDRAGRPAPTTANGVETEDGSSGSCKDPRTGGETDEGVDGPGEGKAAEQGQGGSKANTLEETAGREMDGEYRNG